MSVKSFFVPNELPNFWISLYGIYMLLLYVWSLIYIEMNLKKKSSSAVGLVRSCTVRLPYGYGVN